MKSHGPGSLVPNEGIHWGLVQHSFWGGLLKGCHCGCSFSHWLLPRHTTCSVMTSAVGSLVASNREKSLSNSQWGNEVSGLVLGEPDEPIKHVSGLKTGMSQLVIQVRWDLQTHYGWPWEEGTCISRLTHRNHQNIEHVCYFKLLKPKRQPSEQNKRILLIYSLGFCVIRCL